MKKSNIIFLSVVGAMGILGLGPVVHFAGIEIDHTNIGYCVDTDVDYFANDGEIYAQINVGIGWNIDYRKFYDNSNLIKNALKNAKYTFEGTCVKSQIVALEGSYVYTLLSDKLAITFKDDCSIAYIHKTALDYEKEDIPIYSVYSFPSVDALKIKDALRTSIFDRVDEEINKRGDR